MSYIIFIVILQCNKMDIKPTQYNKQSIEGMDGVYNILHCMLVHTKKLDQNKHLWLSGINQAAYIYYIILITLSTYKSPSVESINPFRVAVMKDIIRMFLLHNHPLKLLTLPDTNKNITDRLFPVGRFLNTNLIDHLIVIPKSYITFYITKLMDDLEQSLKYVPTYQVVERIRKEEKLIAKEKLSVEKDKTKIAQQKAKAEKERLEKSETEKKILINALLDKGVSVEGITKILGITVKAVERLIKDK